MIFCGRNLLRITHNVPKIANVDNLRCTLRQYGDLVVFGLTGASILGSQGAALSNIWTCPVM